MIRALIIGPVQLKTAETAEKTAVPAKPVKFSIRGAKRESSASKNLFSKCVLRNALGWTQAQQIAPSRFAPPPSLSLHPIVRESWDDWVYKRGSTEGFPRAGTLPGLRPPYVISEHTFA